MSFEKKERSPGQKANPIHGMSIQTVQSLSCIQLFATPQIAVRQASLSITNSRSSLRLSPSSQWCHPAISSSLVPFSSCLQSLPASESFPMSQLLAWGGQSTRVSALASFLPKKSQGWSPSEWHHWLDGREPDWTPGIGDGQGGLACCNSWGRKESDTTEQLNWTEVNLNKYFLVI